MQPFERSSHDHRSFPEGSDGHVAALTARQNGVVVLIADDIKSVRQLLRLTLNRYYTVLEAENGAEALELLRQHHPDVAILDVAMPVLNGLEVCQLLRADPDLRTISVIIISANFNQDDARQAGADRFVSKPFLPSELLVAVEDLVRCRAFL